MQTLVVLRKVGANWLPSVPVRQQPYWDEHFVKIKSSLTWPGLAGKMQPHTVLPFFKVG